MKKVRVEPPPHTGWPPGMLQDDNYKLSNWFANKLGSRHQVRQVCAEIKAKQTQPKEPNNV